ncbi:MAG TPA: diguanylate cyclase [Bryobacteraceae bacterium]|nr:diguanylate cyclase [Bryobacteraceae bacterium]
MKVLIADDNSSFRVVLEKMLTKWGYNVILCENGSRALEILQSADPPRLAILDWMMPGMDGVEVCRRVRELNQEPYIYILLLTAKDTSEELVEGMEAGADDYLTKPVDSHELRVRVRAGRRIIDLQEELVHAREALRRQATRDALTGLWNRSAMFDILTRELKRSRRESTTLALIMADLDNFKRINDTLGHTAGDAVLKEAARRMGACVRTYDSPCRYGGEEFLIILPGCDLEGAVLRAEEIRSALAGAPFQIPEGSLAVTCSLGITSTSHAETFDESVLIRQADEALYGAKRNGRNRTEVFTSTGLALVR